jgi:hypothetical protein
MTISSRFALVAVLFSVHAARAQPSATPVVVEKVDPQATTAEWGGGVRVTGLSGIGALPGVNYGAEIAGVVRRDELFAELGFGYWRPEKTYMVTAMPQPVALSLDVWALRVGWASMRMPLRGWIVAELGELAGTSGMQGVVTRMVMGDTPGNRQWRAVGAGLGVAWPMTDHVRLIGNLEVAVPVKREGLMVDRVGIYEPDPMVARYSVGMEVGWR